MKKLLKLAIKKQSQCKLANKFEFFKIKNLVIYFNFRYTINEIVNTEKDYVKDLGVIINVNVLYLVFLLKLNF